MSDTNLSKLERAADAVSKLSDMAKALTHRADALYGRADAQEYSEQDLRRMGANWLSLCKTGKEVRARASKGKMTRAQEAYIVEGWKYARKVAGLSENV